MDPVCTEWSDADAYAPLHEADRSILAWEWLRRDSGYARAALAAIEAGSAYGSETEAGAARWGLVSFEHPARGAPEARPLWRSECHPAVLRVRASAGGPAPDRLDLEPLAPLARLVGTADGREHLLLSDGLRAVRVDILEGTLARGPARLFYLLSGFAAAQEPLLTLRRLIALRQSGRFSRTLHAPEPRARRWVLMLRARDALAAGAAQRDIAALLGTGAAEPRWRSSSPSLRSRAQRLVRAARAMGRGGYLELLR